MGTDVTTRVEALLAKMTLAEKIGQMNQIQDVGEKHYADVRDGKVGTSLFSGGVWGGSQRDSSIRVDLLNAAQRVAVEESRLGIPMLFGRDVIHGFRTLLPIPLAQAAAWDPALVEQVNRVAATEAKSAGIHWTFAPMVDIARDPRWGRIAEGYGEDPHLCAKLGTAAVKGFQTDDPSRPDAVLCTAKHYVGYGAAEGGRDYNTTEITERTLRDVYLPSFKAVVDAGCMTVMSSFNDIGGYPSCANHHVLTEILKGEFGFKGFVFSDWEAVLELMRHGLARDLKHASELAVNAGLDKDMIAYGFIQHMEALVKEGKVSKARIDDACRRILTVKHLAGVFENPYFDTKLHQSVLFHANHLAYARKSAAETMVLLKNRNGLLPLNKNIGSLSVVGPLAKAKNQLHGCWAMDAVDETAVSVAEAVREKVQGTWLITEGGDEMATMMATHTQVIVAVVGEHPNRSGEANDTSTLDLPAGQLEFLQSLKAYDLPLVVVVFAGRPLSIKWIEDNADAILYAWHPGTQGGHAVADVLFGDVNPAGRLPVSFPRTVGQIPCYYNHKPTGRPLAVAGHGGSRYVDLPNSPLYPFGYGLSYTTFEYSKLKVTPKKATVGKAVITVSAEVKNTGTCEGREVVQLYVRDMVGSVSRPVKELKGFQKIALKPGQTKIVTFKLMAEELAFTGPDYKKVTEPGEFKVWIGPDSGRGLEGVFELT
jgi:beta-glucosidase